MTVKRPKLRRVVGALLLLYLVFDLRPVLLIPNVLLYWRPCASCEGAEGAMEITIPPNSTATIYVPAEGGAVVTANGHALAEAEGVTSSKREDGCVVVEVGSGDYRFVSAGFGAQAER